MRTMKLVMMVVVMVGCSSGESNVAPDAGPPGPHDHLTDCPTWRAPPNTKFDFCERACEPKQRGTMGSCDPATNPLSNSTKGCSITFSYKGIRGCCEYDGPATAVRALFFECAP